MRQPADQRATRLARHRSIALELALTSDRRLGERVASAGPLGSGIGGRSAELLVGGVRVFVKRVPLTDLELRPEHLRSTANVFGLPTHYQYGIGSAGFGAWRELAAHQLTTDWVLGGDHPGFPLLHHWRVLPDTPPPGFADEFGGIDGAVAHWDGSPAVRRRLEAIGAASASLVLFLEHLPWTLADWLTERAGPDRGAGQVAAALTGGADFLRAQGFVHFDAHFRNVLTDGRLVCFADLGLALSRRFELSAPERAFLAAHLGYDRVYVVGHLLRHHLLDGVRDHAGYEAFLRGWLAGERPAGLPAAAVALLDRHAAALAGQAAFHRRLLTESRRTPYPAGEIDGAGPADA
ncbi:protein kinase family protein [Streptomyces sp. DSM 44915]|uniref:Protein kinase family protein n=1 Tax=Streptomyces chisholmiae TaxID=3075540 RepID=A0ABU2JJ90_9ACTN|nr:protein kinase family protein [Streptomyces sp. DSM 44915]MDT0265053.1 protein kinase family protein [Streptomyces sp. DSM 44915]